MTTVQKARPRLLPRRCPSSSPPAIQCPTPRRQFLRKTTTTNLLVLTIALTLLAIALRPYIAPAPVQAQWATPDPFYIEPGTQMLRAPDGSKQVNGRVVVDLRNGNVWGFPTFVADTYPINTGSNTPPTSHPFSAGEVCVRRHASVGDRWVSIQ